MKARLGAVERKSPGAPTIATSPFRFRATDPPKKSWGELKLGVNSACCVQVPLCRVKTNAFPVSPVGGLFPGAPTSAIVPSELTAAAKPKRWSAASAGAEIVWLVTPWSAASAASAMVSAPTIATATGTAHSRVGPLLIDVLPLATPNWLSRARSCCVKWKELECQRSPTVSREGLFRQLCTFLLRGRCVELRGRRRAARA